MTDNLLFRFYRLLRDDVRRARLSGSGSRLGVKTGTITNRRFAGPNVARAATDQAPSFSRSSGSS